jgi:hypothetical protein
MVQVHRFVACTALLVALLAPAAGAQEEAPQKRPPGRQPPRQAPARPGLMPGTRAQVKALEEGSITVLILPEQVVRRRVGKDAETGKPEKETKPDKEAEARQARDKQAGDTEAAEAEEERTLKVDGDTAVFLGAVSDREIGGRKTRTYRFVKGSLEDVKPGREVRVHIAGDRASRIDVMPAESPSAGEGL